MSSSTCFCRSVIAVSVMITSRTSPRTKGRSTVICFYFIYKIFSFFFICGRNTANAYIQIIFYQAGINIFFIL